MEVEPLRDRADVKNIHRLLKKWGKVREAECFFIGCCFALRASDLLRIKFDDTTTGYVQLKEKKTGKHKRFPIPEPCKDAIKRLADWYSEQGIEPVYLFQSTGNRAKNLIKPISTEWLARQIVEAARTLGIEYNVGTHTMRKTYGYHAYDAGADIAQLQSLFNHSSEKETLHYIGVTRRTVEEMYTKYSFSLD